MSQLHHREQSGNEEHGPLARWAKIVLVVPAVLSAVVLGGVRFSETTQARAQTGQVLSLPYAGVDYYDPSDYFTHCPDFTWLEESCYNNPSNPDSPRRQLISDLQFVSKAHVGMVQRVWISLDELMLWNPTTGFMRFAPGVLRNVDDMLSLYHQYGVKVSLVLYSYARGAAQNEFHPESLDGRHPAMRSNYLRAARAFLRHLAHSAVDVETAPIIELQNEVYFQLEEYFNDPSHLGTFQECASGSRTDWGCVDRRIIHPWMVALYHTARTASSQFLYTFSDTGRMFENYRYWNKMYPGDLIDEHMYDNAPWSRSSLYAQGRQFARPWIASEVGCASGNVACTYSSPAARSVDTWWLRHLGGDGASSVMVESHVTLWLYPSGPDSQQTTATGDAVASAASLYSVPIQISRSMPGHKGGPGDARRSHPRDHGSRSGPSRQGSHPQRLLASFDHLPLGPLRARPSPNGFSGAVNASDVRVQRGVSSSVPKALSVGVHKGRAAYAYKRFTGRVDHRVVQFSLRLSRHFSLGPHGYMVVAQTRGSRQSSSEAGKVDVMVSAARDLYLTYWSPKGLPKTLWTGYRFSMATWHALSVREIAGHALGSLSIKVDGKVRASVHHFSAPNLSSGYLALGAEYLHVSNAASGHIYVDNVRTYQS